MNRLICTSDDPIALSQLPPRHRASGAPVRVLFLGGLELGFRTQSKTMELFTARRDDIDAVHVAVPVTGLARALSVRAPAFLGGWDFHFIRQFIAIRPIMRRLLRDKLPLDHFDVVQFMTQPRGVVIPELIGKTSAKLVINIDATIPLWAENFFQGHPFWKPDVAWEGRVVRSADLIASISRWSADSCVRDLGLDPSRITLHKPCVIRPDDCPRRQHDETPIRGTPEALAQGTSGLVRIVFVGNDWDRKGGPRLLKWHQQHWRDKAELLVCSGKAPQDHTLKNVTWLGKRSHSQILTELLPSGDLFVMPTRSDTFVIAAQEAQDSGLPVVTTRMAGIPEVVRDNVTGFLCDRDDDDAFVRAVGRLIDDHALRRSMGAATLEHSARNLNSARWYNHYLDQLVRLANNLPVRYAPEGVWIGDDLPNGSERFAPRPG